MTNSPIPSKGAYKPRKNRSKNDPSYEKDLFDAIEHLLKDARVRRDIRLVHRTNRNTKRTTHGNCIEKDTSIVDLMRVFLSDKLLYELHYVPQDLMFIRKSYESYSGTITFSTLYKSFKEIKSKEFKKRFPSITFENLAIALQQNHKMVVDAETLEEDYDVIQKFFRIFKK
ncbi:MAG: hypothetical protein IH571_04425 [Acholeplasmataceae bacterium]|nr:hypothetical protein [Acholeplasmataceae bacterium]